MQVAAIYARYSSDEQRATSIDDQVRRCKALAAQHDFEVKEALVFSDAAVSGSAEKLDKRVGYHQLLAAWDAKAFDAVIVDEVSRLGRDVVEIAKLQVKVGKTGIRLLTADGLDSERSGWELVFGIKGAIGSHFIEEHRHRVVRGMRGQLERDFMIATPPFGYYAERIPGKGDKSAGTLWRINEREAELVRRMYEMRYNGVSYAQIAAELNAQGVPLRRKRRNKQLGGYWRGSRVYQLLRNPVYRGVFVLHGSACAKAKAKRENRELERTEFARPELRIVGDEVWFACNATRRSRPVRGGGRHPFAGLLSCGTCGATLAVTTQKTSAEKKAEKTSGSTRPGGPERVVALHCAQCDQAHHAKALAKGPPYVSAAGVEALLRHVLERAVTGEWVTEFRRFLKSMLAGDRDAELATRKAQLQQAKAARDRLARLLAEVNGDDEVLEREYFASRARHEQLADEVKALEAGVQAANREAAARAQLQADPRAYLGHLLTPGKFAAEARAVLARLFPSIVLLGKESRYVSRYEVTLLPGVLFAQATGTPVIDETPVTLRFRVSTTARRPVVWTIEELSEDKRQVA